MQNLLKKIFGNSNDTTIKKLNKTVALIVDKEEEYAALSNEQLTSKTQEFKHRLAQGETLDDLLVEAFATAREAAWRSIGMRPYPVQLLGGIVLHQGRVAEMKTGEGKTLVAVLPAYLNALSEKGVHIVTVNDYLAKRDSEWMGKVHRFLGLSVGLIIHDLSPEERRQAYLCDITYGTNNELGFDYLRDNMVIHKQNMVQRGHHFAIVDEVDSILIDEARTPLIISGQGEESTDMYQKANRFVIRLKNEEDYEIDEKQKAVILTEEGTRKAESTFSIDNLSDIENTDLNHHILQALKANVMMKKDVDYVVQNNEVLIVDEFTGRLMVGRRYSDGLHQAIEAKERVTVARESKTLATITFQNYFRMYKKLSGMTGTAKTEEGEFQGIYALDVVEIPTNKPSIRKDLNDLVYKNPKGKFNAVVEEIVQRHQTGQPMLVGTVSVETSEMLSHMLKLKGVPHEVLNAKHHQKEAEIVAQAGHYGAVTIATNMAGRGTDILLGGNPDYLARRTMRQEEYEPELIEEATGHNENVPQEILNARTRYHDLVTQFEEKTGKEHQRVLEVGGLHIIGTERHESRRIDNQLRGRSGRQGDPGSTQFFISLDDDLMRVAGSEKIQPLIERLGMDDDQPMEAKMLTRQIETAQKRIEGRNFDIRRHVLQYDDVMNQQRGVIYGQRRQVLEGEDVRNTIHTMISALIDDSLQQYCSGEDPSTWDVKGLFEYWEKIGIPSNVYQENKEKYLSFTLEDLKQHLQDECNALYVAREAFFTHIDIDMREFERVILLSSVDRRWMDHIDAMDQLRDGIGLRAYGQKDPVTEYKMESYDMFDEMVHLIQEDTVKHLLQAKITAPPQRRAVATPTHAGVVTKKKDFDPKDPSIARNGPCPCGSGKKFKHCCGKDL
ncbi:MAG: preprotein translocase subunit SecA [Clostridiales bacterium]|nr:preprotein translocase subunit SecA [Clostridiales bacterium]